MRAATLSYYTVDPVLGTNDISNFSGAAVDAENVNDGGTYADGGANDGFTYVAFDRGGIGQTFTTGPNGAGYQLKAIWVRHVGYTNNTAQTYYMAPAGSDFQIRLTDPAQSGTVGFVLATEIATTTGGEANALPTGIANTANGTARWLRFALGTPLNLNANTVYGFDVSSPNSFGGYGSQPFFETFGTSNNVYAAGVAYTSGPNGSGGDDSMTACVGDRVFALEMAGQVVVPTIVAHPANRMVVAGGVASLTASASGTLPLVYQWYFNATNLLSGQTNATLSFVGVTTNLVGNYSVVVTNDGGSKTSSVARLSVILPTTTTNINFSVAAAGILDANSIGTPFPTRLEGTGTSLPTPDTNLLMDTNTGTLDITSTTCDFNGQLLMDQAEAIGLNLSALGFNGSQDFLVTGTFTNLPVGTYVNYDQVGVFVGASCTNFVRGGLIFNSDFANLSSYGVATPANNDAGFASAIAPPDEMVVTISRAAGSWSVVVNGLSVTPNVSLEFLNGYTNLTTGIFALDTSGTHNVTRVDAFSVSLFVGPKLNVALGGSNLTFTWNVVGAGLESNTDLSNPNGWSPVVGANASPYVMSVPTTGNRFYRIAK